MKGCWCNSKGFSHLHQSQLWWGPLQGEWWETLLWKMELVVLLYHWHYDPASKCAYWNGFPLSWDAGNEIMSLSRNKMGLVKPAALTGRHKCFWFKTNKRNHQPPSKKQQQKTQNQTKTKPQKNNQPNQKTKPKHPPLTPAYRDNNAVALRAFLTFCKCSTGICGWILHSQTDHVK